MDVGIHMIYQYIVYMGMYSYMNIVDIYKYIFIIYKNMVPIVYFPRRALVKILMCPSVLERLMKKEEERNLCGKLSCYSLALFKV